MVSVSEFFSDQIEGFLIPRWRLEMNGNYADGAGKCEIQQLKLNTNILSKKKKLSTEIRI